MCDVLPTPLSPTDPGSNGRFAGFVQRFYSGLTSAPSRGPLRRSANPASVSTAAAAREDLKSTTYEFFILAISILSIVNLALEVFVQYRSQSWYLILFIDSALTLIFLGDFTYRLTTAPTKWWYLRHGGGVFDFLGCLPGCASSVCSGSSARFE